MKKLIKKHADPNQLEAITLGEDAYLDQLYGCFRINNPRGDAFTPERNVEIVARSGRRIAVTVPRAMIVDLPADTKVVNSAMFKLECIGNHLDTMHLLTMRACWNQTDQDIRRMTDMDKNGSFVARLQGYGFDIPVGTSSVLPLGRHNTWIGMILVHPEARRQGIANAMMQACVKYAIDQDKVINGLDATPMGNTVYGAVGYVNSYRIWRSFYQLAEFAESRYDATRVKTMTAADLDAVIRYDAAAFLERENIMRRLFADGEDGCFVYRDDAGVIRGYCYTRPGRQRPFVGPFIADTDEIARDLLIAASQHLARSQAGPTAGIDTPESKFNHPGVYVEREFDQKQKPSGHRLIKTITLVRDFTRMYQLVDEARAEKLVWDFAQAEGLESQSPRLREFADTMHKSVFNYTETLAFMNLERDSLQQKFWGITGPEKG